LAPVHVRRGFDSDTDEPSWASRSSNIIAQSTAQAQLHHLALPLLSSSSTASLRFRTLLVGGAEEPLLLHSPSMAGADAGPAPSASKRSTGGADMKRNHEQGGADRGQKRKKKKEVFIYGNYRNYYGYRVSKTRPPPPSSASSETIESFVAAFCSSRSQLARRNVLLVAWPSDERLYCPIPV
jgi:hypothetical protein